MPDNIEFLAIERLLRHWRNRPEFTTKKVTKRFGRESRHLFNMVSRDLHFHRQRVKEKGNG